MPLPTSADVHVDQLLTNVSIAYKNASYIADQIFPIVPVPKQSNIIPQYPQSYWFRDEAQLRAPGTKAVGGGYAVDNTTTYFSKRYSFAKDIPDEVRDNADAPYNLDREAAEFCTDKVMLRREAAFAAANFTTGVWGTNVVGGTDFTAWSNYAGSAPLSDVEGWQQTVRSKIARPGNKIVMGRQVLTKLKWHPDIVDTIKYTQKGIVSEDLIRAVFGVDQLLTGDGIVTTTAEGTAEASVTYSFIWGKSVLLAYVAPSPSLMTPTAGLTVTWARVPGSINYVQRFRLDEEETDRIVANTYFDQKVLATNAGHFASLVVA